jgi:hypothetical protein
VLKLASARGQRGNLRRLLVRQLDANHFFLGCRAAEMGVKGWGMREEMESTA